MKKLCLYILHLFFGIFLWAQESTFIIDTTFFNDRTEKWIAREGRWYFKDGNDISWANPDLDMSEWDTLRPTQITTEMADEKGRFEGWFRLKIKVDSLYNDGEIGLIQRVWAATDVFVDGELVTSFGNTGLFGGDYTSYDRDVLNPTLLPFKAGEEHVLAIHVVDEVAPLFRVLKSEIHVLNGFVNLVSNDYKINMLKSRTENQSFWGGVLGFTFVLLILIWLIFIINKSEIQFLFIAIAVTTFSIAMLPSVLDQWESISFQRQQWYDYMSSYLFVTFVIIFPLTLGQIFKRRISRIHWILTWVAFVVWNFEQVGNFGISNYFFDNLISPLIVLGSGIVFSIYYLFSAWRKLKGAMWAIVVGILLPIFSLILAVVILMLSELLGNDWAGANVSDVFLIGFFFSFPTSLLVYVVLWYHDLIKDIRHKSSKLVSLANENQEILASQKENLEKEVQERTKELNTSISKLKSTQTQLIHSEKMASLGELTAGIAHEIQNPLNFVNNFSDLNKDMLVELQEAIKNKAQEEIGIICKDLLSNEEKVTHHGKRAEEIVKSMLQHSRTGSGEQELTDINLIADEYLRLAYHGLRAKDKSFNAEFKTELDSGLPKIKVVPQDIGRVLLNLINNGFQAVREVDQPEIIVTTQRKKDKIEIRVKDNGPGIPDEVREKIFQPFFTTKATGSGTGLGLSLSYDIITKGHGGTIEVKSQKNQGATFTINLPFA
jgi:signal transduction histidine kinase